MDIIQQMLDLLSFGYTHPTYSRAAGSPLALISPEGKRINEEDFQKEIDHLLED